MRTARYHEVVVYLYIHTHSATTYMYACTSRSQTRMLVAHRFRQYGTTYVHREERVPHRGVPTYLPIYLPTLGTQGIYTLFRSAHTKEVGDRRSRDSAMKQQPTDRGCRGPLPRAAPRSVLHCTALHCNAMYLCQSNVPVFFCHFLSLGRERTAVGHAQVMITVR